MVVRGRYARLLAAMMAGSAASALSVSAGQAQQQQAAYAYVTANLNQRAGPATRFPSLGVVPARQQVRINGCLADLSWCEGAVGDTRGWMSAAYLRLYDYRQQAWVEVDNYAGSTALPRYTFDLERYWGQHYADRNFYAQRAAWVAPPRSPSIDTGVFYRELSPYGRWVSLEGRYVWMPQVERGWRPYTDGRWEYTRRYGWTWVSNEPFGWATYHYGRWAYSNRLGWVWQPGTQWAPAWVAWRGSEDHLAWAPLPPDAGPGFRLGDDFGQIPSYYWQVVPSRDFLRPDLREVVIRDDDRGRRDWLDRARPIGNSTVVNNVVVNNVVNVEYIEQQTQQRVVPREVVITNRAQPDRPRGEAQVADDIVRIYQPPVAEAPASATPPTVLPADVAAGQSQTTGQAGDEPTTEGQLAETPPPAEAASPPTEAPPLAPEEAEAEQPVSPEEQPAAPTDEQAAPPAAGEEPPAPPAAGEEPPPPPAAGEEPPPPTASEEPPAPPAAGEEPPPPAAGEEPPPAPDEAAPPPAPEEPAPPPAGEEPAPPPPAAAEEPPPPPDEAAPPPAPDEPAPPPPAAEPAPPPPAAAEEPPPPPDEAAPPPTPEEPAPPAAIEEPAPPPPPAEAAPPPPEPEPAPPPPAAVEDPAPPPPPAAEEPPPAPEAAPPPAPEEPVPPPAAEEPAPPPAAEEGNRQGGNDCPEGMRMNRQGECVQRRN